MAVGGALEEMEKISWSSRIEKKVSDTRLKGPPSAKAAFEGIHQMGKCLDLTKKHVTKRSFLNFMTFQTGPGVRLSEVLVKFPWSIPSHMVSPGRNRSNAY